MRQPSPPRRPLTARHPAASAASAVAAATAALLLAGCGTATTAASGGGPEGSGSPRPCGSAPPSAPGVPQPPALAQGGARITAVGRTCFEYEVTNPNAEPYDYTVVFNGPDPDRGAAVFGGPGGGGNLTRTVTGLAPGATEKGRIDLTAPGATGPGSRPGAPTLGRSDNPRPPKPELLQVRSVPTAEAPSAGGPCPPSGLRLYADEGSAAMGLRAVGLHLRNCGTATVTLDGYPQVQPLDPDHKPLDGVRILRGGAEIASGTGADNPPQKIALGPGEGARATLVWRNTTEAGAGDPQNAPYVRVRATADAAPVMVVPELDLGTTGRLGAGAWAREDANDKPSPDPRP
ncbi:DUF4232 domain-containing protein [Kitasatospora xanthocidica]|uniref:DUF4232 domain-containing protein n=1 Tax=Kitasatospora xanthocidica TaxID=83382 RepID=A0A372ZKY2_9ACTN|nr:DUF4232 domain-containing protein [Kitasatospora xanthocidica]RGD56513.1 DUF4232 domain-containing protein [Kitasatospora xanthocidica]